MAKQITPILRPLRKNSGTIYVFPSAIEDIGLNLDIRANKVCLSKYVVLNLPKTDTTGDENTRTNYFNFSNIPGLANLFNNNTNLTSEQKIAAALQNYMMNFETVLINQSDYDYSLSKTVSERVFWKFLKETGAIRWQQMDADQVLLNGDLVYTEEGETYEDGTATGYQRVVQSVGLISSGNSISNDFGMYNETYVNIPSSYGGSQIFFKITEDNNYRLGEVYTSEDEDYLAGRDADLNSESYTINCPVYDYQSISEDDENREDITAEIEDTGLAWYQNYDETNDVPYSYFTEPRLTDEDSDNLNYDITLYDSDEEEMRTFMRSRLDGVEVLTDIDEITDVFNQFFDANEITREYISFDSINTEKGLIANSQYDFNAILLYYTVYDKDNGNELATNLFGIMFLNGIDVDTMDAAYNTGDKMKWDFQHFTKIKSGGSGSDTYFGTGYSFKVNIRSLSLYDNSDAVILDNTTSDSLYTEDFNEVVYNLNKSVEILTANSLILDSVYNDYINLRDSIDKNSTIIENLNSKINEIASTKFTDLDIDSIIADDVQISESLKIAGYLQIDENTGMEIPFFDVSTLIAGDVSASIGNFGELNADSMALKSITVSNEIDLNKLVINEGVVYLSESDCYVSNSSIYNQVVEPTDWTYDASSFNEEMMAIIENTNVKPVNNMFEIIPSSFETLVDYPYTEGFYTNKIDSGYVNYIAYIPVLVGSVGYLNEKINNLNLDSSTSEIFTELTNNISSMKSTIEGLEASVNDLEKNNTNLDSSISELKVINANLDSSISQLKLSNNQLKIQVEILKKMLEKNTSDSSTSDSSTSDSSTSDSSTSDSSTSDSSTSDSSTSDSSTSDSSTSDSSTSDSSTSDSSTSDSSTSDSSTQNSILEYTSN